MEVQFKTLTQKKFTLTIEPTITIDELHQLIATHEQKQKEEICLIYQSKKLKDFDAPFSSLNYQPSLCITVLFTKISKCKNSTDEKQKKTITPEVVKESVINNTKSVENKNVVNNKESVEKSQLPQTNQLQTEAVDIFAPTAETISRQLNKERVVYSTLGSRTTRYSHT